MKFLVSPEHARQAIQAEVVTAYVVYCLLRATTINHNGSSHFTKSSVKNQLSQLNFSPRKWTRIFKQGDGIFWNLDYKNLYLRSYRRVTRNLKRITQDSIDYSQRFLVQVELEANSDDTHATLSAKLYFSWFLARGEVTISRQTLSDIFGLTPDQQRNYESILDGFLLIKHNYAHIDMKQYENKPVIVPDHHFTIGYERLTSDNRLEDVNAIQYQLPNTFIASGNGDAPTTTESTKSLIKACRSSKWHTLSYLHRDTAYAHNWREFEHSKSNAKYVRAYYQGAKRLWLSSHYV